MCPARDRAGTLGGKKDCQSGNFFRLDQSLDGRWFEHHALDDLGL
jgi:hypothetical protein